MRVAAGQPSATLTFRNSQRLTSPDATTFQRTTADTRPLVQLRLRGATGTLSDDAYVYAEAGATPGVDAQYDAVKLPNSNGLNLSMAAAGQQLAINGLPAFTTGTTVPLSVGVPAAGAYALQVAQLLNLPAGTAAVLVDTQLGTRTDLAALPAAGYAFSVTSAQAAALLTGRFFLNLAAAAPLATAAGRATATLQLYPNPAHGGAATLTGALPGTAVTVMDALGRTVVTATADAAGTAALALPASLPAGVYVVRAGTRAVKLTVE